jgi:hypothetical protein
MQLAPFVHGFDAHSLTSIEQVSPSNPAMQAHTKLPIATVSEKNESRQTPEFTHGAEAHSFTSIWQDSPVHPEAHEQEKLATKSVHAVAAFWHGSGEQSSTLSSQLSPVKPSGQTHQYVPSGTDVVSPESKHTPPFVQVAVAHSAMSVSQLSPVVPTGHAQLDPSARLVQLPLCAHGCAAQ